MALLAFVRLATKQGLFPSPLDPDEALDRVEAWLGQRLRSCWNRPWTILESCAAYSARRGRGAISSTTSTLAALALEHRCVIVSYDNHFDRFDGIRTEQPA